MSNYSELLPKIGIELEFYLTYKNKQIDNLKLIEKFIAELKAKILDQKIKILAIQKEQGRGQIEIKTIPYLDIDQLLLDIKSIKKISQKLAIEFGFEANFNPIPFLNDCSNAMQINLTLLDKKNKNLFDKKNNQESKILLNVIAGLLEKLPEYIDHFSDKSRFNLKRNKELFISQKYTSPVNLSWGYDNRSCAIRVVGKGQDRRLEFRIADADIDIKKAIKEFFKMVKYGINNDSSAPEPIYGNAFDKNYEHLQLLG